MKVSIRTKIILLGAVLSILATGIALLVSYLSSKSALTKQLDTSVQNSMIDLHDTFYTDLFRDDYIEGTEAVKDYIVDIYNNNPDVPEFETVQEEKEYLTHLYAYMYYIYPDFEGLIMYPGLAAFSKQYIALRSLLNSAKILSGSNKAYIAFYDNERNRLVYMLDDSFGKLEYLNEERFPGTYKTDMTKPSDDSVNISTYSTGKTIIKSIPIYKIYDEKVVGNPIAYVFLEYDYNKTNEEIKKTTLINFATLGSVALLLIILYALVSHFLIVKNLKKLSSSTMEFTKALNSGEEINSINPNVKSKDELEQLSASFVSLEDEIINYINVIKEETITKERMNAELNVASKIQLEALPNKQYDDKDISVRAYIQSAKEVGGDFYDYFYLDETHLAFCICDVSGKGVPASLFMMRGKELIKSKLLSNNSIENVLYDVNNSLLNNNEEGLFITAFVGIIDLVKDELTFVSAGHERPFIITNEGIEQLKCNSNFILSGIKDFNYKSETIPFKKGTTIFLHTDGLNEAINAQREEFGYERILSSLDETKNSSLDEKITNLNNKLKEFVGDEEPFDDETLLFVQNINLELDEKYENPGYEVIEDYTNKFNNMFGFLEQKVKYEFGVIFDELLNNVVSYEKADVLILEVNAKLEKDTIKLTVSSNGQEYNPLLNKDNYIDKYSDDLQVGGFGVTIIKNLVDSIKYNRKDRKNVLTLTKKI